MVVEFENGQLDRIVYTRKDARLSRKLGGRDRVTFTRIDQWWTWPIASTLGSTNTVRTLTIYQSAEGSPSSVYLHVIYREQA